MKASAACGLMRCPSMGVDLGGCETLLLPKQAVLLPDSQPYLISLQANGFCSCFTAGLCCMVGCCILAPFVFCCDAFKDTASLSEELTVLNFETCLTLRQAGCDQGPVIHFQEA